MLSQVVGLLTYAGVALCGPGTPGPAADTRRTIDLEELYRSGVPFSEFYAGVERRGALWTENYTTGEVDADRVDRVASLQGRWRLLAIAEDWCSDSVNTIPFLALLAEKADNLELRVIDSQVGRELMEAHRTSDGRPATPTVLVLNEAYEAVGCWIERPASLQDWALGDGARLTDEAFMTEKMRWYRDDGGRSTVSEVVGLIEAAARGATTCPGA